MIKRNVEILKNKILFTWLLDKSLLFDYKITSYNQSVIIIVGNQWIIKTKWRSMTINQTKLHWMK